MLLVRIAPFVFRKGEFAESARELCPEFVDVVLIRPCEQRAGSNRPGDEVFTTRGSGCKARSQTTDLRPPLRTLGLGLRERELRCRTFAYPCVH